MELREIAERVAWFQKPEQTLANTEDFLCRVMALGTWEDTIFCLERFGKESFRRALRHAPSGVFSPRAWNYWSLKLETPLPPPRRKIPDAAET